MTGDLLPVLQRSVELTPPVFQVWALLGTVISEGIHAWARVLQFVLT
ncbi:hypothetical protein HRbin36_00054 [bacterium HR36]|nr:hypothetical protein HRbin36_00054 [bacterium HR36]